jgi:PAS domain S-box-containing protein
MKDADTHQLKLPSKSKKAGAPLASTAERDEAESGNDANAVQQQLQELKHLYETAPVGLCLMDTELRFVHINERLAAINGRAVADHIGKTLKEVIPQIADKVTAIYEEVIESGQAALDFEISGVTPADPNRVIDGLCSYYPIKAEDGTVLGVGTVVQEITQRKQAERALQESEERFRTICQNAPVMIDAFDQKGQCLFYNAELEKKLGWTYEEFLASDDPLSLVYPNRKDREQVLKSIKRADGLFREYHPHSKDGTLRTQMWADFRLPTGTSISVGYDITEQKKTEQKLREANELLEKRVAERTAELRKALTQVRNLKSQLEAENVYLQEELKHKHSFEDIIGKSLGIRDILQKVEHVAPTDASALILGETGTGKELVARAIHTISPLGKRPLVKVNCAALPATLIESELFGHERGAFTGAHSRKRGRFELADGGTIFLDEIGDLPLALQSKLLKVLQSGEFERVGSEVTRKVNVRVLAATNHDLKDAMEKGTFREDLYFRLNVFPINVPPLRERQEDIPLLTEHFVRKYAKKLQKKIDSVAQTAMDMLVNYSWPGNIRELENIIERAVIITNGKTIRIDDSFLPSQKKEISTGPSVKLEDVEREHIQRTLDETNWIIEGKRGAALRLGLNHGTLRSRMRKLGIKRPH